MLNEEQIENIIKKQTVIFTTSSRAGQPRSIYVTPSRVGKNLIVLSNLQMSKSLQNVKENPKCFINVYIPEKDELQYKIEGVAEVIEMGDLFEQIKDEKNLPNELQVHSLISIRITSVEESHWSM